MISELIGTTEFSLFEYNRSKPKIKDFGRSKAFMLTMIDSPQGVKTGLSRLAMMSGSLLELEHSPWKLF